jgi:cytochrome c
MDSFEWNKIAGGILASVLFVLVVHIGSQAAYYVPPPAKPGYIVQGVVEPTAGGAPAPAPVAEAIPDFATVIPKADPAVGMTIADRCAVCHDWSKGGPNKIGPNLYGVVGRPRAMHEGFDYSPAMKAKGGSWTYQDLFTFLAAPAQFVPGTKMTFAGLPKAQDRLNVIAFLRTQADAPFPLPPPAPAAAPDAAAAPGAPAGADAVPKAPAAAGTTPTAPAGK